MLRREALLISHREQVLSLIPMTQLGYMQKSTRARNRGKERQTVVQGQPPHWVFNQKSHTMNLAGGTGIWQELNPKDIDHGDMEERGTYA